MQLAVRLDKRPGESHMAFGQKKKVEWLNRGVTELSESSQLVLSQHHHRDVFAINNRICQYATGSQA